MTNKKWLLINIVGFGYYMVFTWAIYYFESKLPIELPLTLSFLLVALLLLLGLNHLIEKE
jgi:hypothetical protein